MRSVFVLALIILSGHTFSQNNIQVIIDNGFLSNQGWGGNVHPSGNYFVRSDRTIIQAYSVKNGMLFQTYQSQCITDKILFSEDGNYLIALTFGEIEDDLCRKVIIFDFFNGKIIFNKNGYYVESLDDPNSFFLRKKLNQNEDEYVLEKYLFKTPEKQVETIRNIPIDSPESGGALEIQNLSSRCYISEKFIFECDDSHSRLYVYDRRSLEHIANIDANTYLMQFDKSNNQIILESNSKSTLIFLNLNNLQTTNYELPFKTFYHYFWKNTDSTFNFVNIRQNEMITLNLNTEKYVRQPFGFGHNIPYLTYDNGDSYKGSAHAKNNMVVHQNEQLFDFENHSLTAYPMQIDTSLLHPAVIYIFPEDPSKIVINGIVWNMTQAQQLEPWSPKNFITTHRYTESVYSSSLYMNNYFGDRASANYYQHLFPYMIQQSDFLEFNNISYPLKDLEYFFDFEDLPIVKPHYSLLYDNDFIEWFAHGDSIYVVLDDSTMLSVSAKHIFEGAAEKEKYAKKIIESHFNPDVIYELNKSMPEFIFGQPDEGKTYYFKRYLKKYKNWLYSPFPLREHESDFAQMYRYGSESAKTSYEKIEVTNFETAKKEYLGNCLKVAYSGCASPDFEDYFIINIMENTTAPDITLAGIYPSIDFFFYDITFPILNNRYLSINYAHGIIKLLDENKNIIVQSSFYEGNEFIHLTPDGYYFASKNVSSKISIRSEEQVYPIEQFDLKYNRPDIVLERLGCNDKNLLNAYHQAYLKRLKRLNFTEEMLRADFHLPKLEIENPKQLSGTNQESIDFTLKMTDTLYLLDRIHVWVNDVAVFGENGISLRENKTQSITKEITIPLAYGSNKIQLSVLNQAGAESYKETIHVECSAGKKDPDLYVLSFGVSQYKDQRYNLSYASKDAKDLVLAFEQDNYFKSVYSKTVTDSEVTLENIASLKSFFDGADINDQVIIFVAGHGVLDHNFNYYFASYDMDFQNPSARGIPYEMIESLLDGIKPLKKLLFMDTCHSGEVDKDEIQVANNNSESENDIVFRNVGVAVENKESQLGVQNTSELMKSLFTDLRKGTGATVISSASGVEFAMESDRWKNGLFTYCLIHGLTSNLADLNKDAMITVSELQLYIQTEVSKLSNGKQTPTSRIQNQAMDYRIW